MAYCHECGSKVAENDIFCPYCGISLKPISVGGAERDISSDKTIIGNPPVNFPAAENEVNSKKVCDGDALKSVPKENSDDLPTSFAEIPTAENYDFKSESVDVPAENQSSQNDEVLVSNESPSAEKSETGKFENVSQEIPAPEVLSQSSADAEIPVPENIEILKPIEDEPKQEEISFVKSKITDSIDENEPLQNVRAKVETTEIDNEPIESKELSVPDSDSNQNEFTVNSDVFPENFTLNPDEANASANHSENVSKEKFIPNVNVESQSQIEAEASSKEAISKPKFDLEPLQRSKSEAVFDSVQIVQREEKPVEEKSAEIDNNQQEITSKEVEKRSYTTPNFVGSDTDGKSNSKLKPLDEGTVLNNRYEIVRKIGGGGMGAVYLASDKNLGGVLRAVKEMVQSYIEETQQDKAVADFKRESMLLTSLEHQAIPTIFDYFYDEKEARFYLVMKYISGGDLSSRLRSAPEGRIDEKSVTEWAIQVADVLEYLHRHQPPIVYRDLKPANIMIDGNSGRIMLIDFGIARWVNKEEKGVTAVGTMGYAPPELFSGNVEARSDIYSLGSTMFHLLTGADPQSNPLLIFDFQKNPRPRQINPQLSDQMERILMRSVEYNSEKRFSSAEEMKQVLQEQLDNLKTGKVTFGVSETPASIALSEQPVFCGFCGQRIVATDMFCAFCGAKQPIAQQGVHYSNQASASMTAKLMILGTNDLESPSFYLEKDENLVGRRDPMSNIFPEIDLSKFDPQTKISRRHARIWREGNNFMVEDLGSSNGTVLLPTINDTIRLLPHQPHILASGDKLKVGDTTMHFVIG
jgi:serine/threonine protein kinase